MSSVRFMKSVIFDTSFQKLYEIIKGKFAVGLN